MIRFLPAAVLLTACGPKLEDVLVDVIVINNTSASIVNWEACAESVAGTVRCNDAGEIPVGDTAIVELESLPVFIGDELLVDLTIFDAAGTEVVDYFETNEQIFLELLEVTFTLE